MIHRPTSEATSKRGVQLQCCHSPDCEEGGREKKRASRDSSGNNGDGDKRRGERRRRSISLPPVTPSAPPLLSTPSLPPPLLSLSVVRQPSTDSILYCQRKKKWRGRREERDSSERSSGWMSGENTARFWIRCCSPRGERSQEKHRIYFRICQRREHG